MCGIAGTIGTLKKNRVSHLISSLKHSGPDSSPTIVIKDNAYIAATRLSIVDVENGSQPMFDKKSGNILALNGEIYNHLYLRNNLKRSGVKFN